MDALAGMSISAPRFNSDNISVFSNLRLFPEEKKNQEDEHAPQLKKEQDEVAKLKAELAGLTEKHIAEVKRLTDNKAHLETQVKGFKEFGQDKES